VESVVEILKETTVGFKPHTYYLNAAGKCVGYATSGEASSVKIFNKPLSFSKSYRKFNKVIL